MQPVCQLDVPWLAAAPVRRVLACLNPDPASPTALIVGGAVRDAIRGQMDAPQDIDIATTFTPEIVTALARHAGLAVHPTGIDHGTVTLVCDHMPFQVTTLRRDVATDGRRAVVAYTDDWAVDASRRDFTINTLLLDGLGHVYDPLGHGIADIKSGRIVFVGDPAERLQEDALRLLRYYRFWALCGRPECGPDLAVARVLRAAAPRLKTLSVERISAEFTKILGSAAAVAVLDKMFQKKVMVDYPRHRHWRVRLRKVIDCDGDIAMRYWALLPTDLTYRPQYLLMTRALRQGLEAYRAGWDILLRGRFSGQALRRCAYHTTPQVARMLGRYAGMDVGVVPDVMPQCPVRAADIQAVRSDIHGSELGALLKHAEKRWIASDFQLDKAALLNPLCQRRQ